MTKKGQKIRLKMGNFCGLYLRKDHLKKVSGRKSQVFG